MIPWLQLGRAQVPNGSGELRLKQRGSEYSIMLGSNELMNSRLSGSEEALATLAADRLAPETSASVLIGGLGMGFTLRAAINAFGPTAKIDVAELVPEVISWARGPLKPLFGECLAQPGVTIIKSDVLRLIRSKKSVYDAILLDVDNGPDGLTNKTNDRIYNLEGLNSASASLRPSGILAVWSTSPDKSFTQRLCRAGFSVEEVIVRAVRGKTGARHTIWLAKRSKMA